MNDFWDRKRQELQSQQPQAGKLTGAPGPWWSVSGNNPGTQVVEPQTKAQSYLEALQRGDVEAGSVDGHNVKRAEHIKKEDYSGCPNCGRDGYFAPTTNTAKRCYFCGHMEGRDFTGLIGINPPAIVEGSAQKAKQTSSGGASIHNFRGNITSASQATGRIS